MTEQVTPLTPQEPPKDGEPIKTSGSDEADIVTVLQGYFDEAEKARSGGENPRDEVWELNWNRYWLRYDMSDKASWQSQHVMPEVPQYVDRWAAAMREALTTGGQWFSAVDESGQSNALTPHIEKFMNVLLSRCTKTPDGHDSDFESFFEDEMKLGALMTMSAAVTWKDGWVSVEATDPREVWLDPLGRNLYRVRQYEIDHHDLIALAEKTDSIGDPLYNLQAVMELKSHVDAEMREHRDTSSGHGTDSGSTHRKPIKIQEFLCDLIMPDGDVMGENQLCVVANDRFLIRGPEPNPFWHESDWHVNSPMVPVPFSVYGKSYAEEWAGAADAFVELTNLILDGVYTSAMRVFWGQPEALEDPTQLDEGLSPNIVLKLAEGVTDGRKVLGQMELGQLPSDAFRVWTALKQEMQEGAKLNDIALGQVPPKGGITATEVTAVSQSGSAMVRSMARTVESRFLEPTLTLIFQTGLQHMDFADPQIQAELGAETAAMLQARKEEFRTRKIKFKVRSISGLIDRQSKLRNLMSMLQTVSGNEILLKSFLEKVDMGQLIERMFTLFGVDKLELQLSEREKMIQQVMGAAQPGQPQGSQPRPPGESSNPMEGGI